MMTEKTRNELNKLMANIKGMKIYGLNGLRNYADYSNISYSTFRRYIDIEWGEELLETSLEELVDIINGISDENCNPGEFKVINGKAYRIMPYGIAKGFKE